ncbi:hypothetical protein PtrSN002B_002978 [Pyrenophora tritici-repentis]|nr:hypothetical protein PtrV1_07857 [Pyrenophora tritici-repentis]KAF7571104.1 hypothetical protein PtrM4_111060 [Pyrenophora tritici-repentis]KAG9384159.1 hypothetical protein A1F94_006070 [Pyrenophora tritici-repentis]KAI0581590.1 hypothetical protein Alg215_04580 [Pyrenophora tritici-repentis]KAI1543228.1 hypothetical protein PtrSN001A_003145 [Pyrenophora tritici-repentis]
MRELVRDWDASETGRSYTPYSNQLNTWYKALFNTDEKSRITAKALVENYVPTIDSDIDIVEMKQSAKVSFKAAERLRARVATRQATRQAVSERGDTRSINQDLEAEIVAML